MDRLRDRLRPGEGTDDSRSDDVSGARGLCRRLRWKAMFLPMNADPGMPSMDDGFVWCTHTHNCLGPDGEVAGKEICRAGRGCYER